MSGNGEVRTLSQHIHYSDDKNLLYESLSSFNKNKRDTKNNYDTTLITIAVWIFSAAVKIHVIRLNLVILNPT